MEVREHDIGQRCRTGLKISWILYFAIFQTQTLFQNAGKWVVMEMSDSVRRRICDQGMAVL